MLIRPDFFIVGAPKCGTTALYSYLRRHPDIFMPLRKEPHYFGSDLRRSHQDDLDTYLSYFAPGQGALRVGEASTSYLYSRRGAAEIKVFAPDARIIVMLREPAAMIHSLHAQRVFQGAEPIADFARAIASEDSRRRQLGLPDPPDTTEGPIYRPIARYADQLERYFDAFGRDRVHVIIYDDLRADSAGVYRSTLRFLAVDDDFLPELAPVNERKAVRSLRVTRLLRTPPPPLTKLAHRVLSRRSREWIYGRVRALNTIPTPPAVLDPALRRSLQAEFADEVSRVSDLLGRDLSAWSRPAEG